MKEVEIELRVLFVLGSGGHTARGLILSKQLKAEKYYIVPWESEVTKKKVGKNYYSVISPRFRAKDSRIMSIFRTLLLFLHSLLILFRVRPHVLVSTGSGLTLPPFLIARLFGIKTIFIESPSRVYEPSIAGKLLMGKTNLWLSSWPQLAKRYAAVKHEGMILDESSKLEAVSGKKSGIFVTVGTSLPYDGLIEAIDNLVSSSKITDKVVAQIGEGKYRPKHIEYFRFRPGLDEYFSNAEVIVSNCGAGTIMENVTNGRRLVAIQNPDITGGHEWELVTMMERGKHLVWCRDIGSLLGCISKAKEMAFEKYKPKKLNIQNVIEAIL